MKNLKYLMLLALCATALFSCKKDEEKPGDDENEEKTAITFMFDLRGKLASDGSMENLDLTHEYLTPEGDTLEINEFKMYVSNFILIKEDDSEVSLGDTYFLLNQTTSENQYRTMKTVNDVPVGDYKSLKFTVGIDENCNSVEACTTGDLDPFDDNSTGMIWDWSSGSGYKFVKFEGDFRGNNTSTTGAVNDAFALHVGGNANAKTVTISGDAISTVEGETTMLHLMVMTPQLLSGPNTIDMEDLIDKSEVAENYASGMFMLHHVVNPE